MTNKRIAIAVDGPAGAGKSSISKVVAKQLGYTYIDTGAMYRGVTWAVLNKGVDVKDQEAVEALLPDLGLTVLPGETGCRIMVQGKDITDYIRSSEINNNVSIIASYKGVRQYLVERQQWMAKQGGVILDGRDIGSVVLPDAELKIYLTASVKARAYRRYLEVKGTANEEPLEAIEQSVAQRDHLDMTRDESPLVCVPDAVVVDSSDLTFDETVARMIQLVEERLA